MTIYVPHSKIVIAGLSYVQPVAAASYLQVKVIAEVTMPDVLSVDVVTPVDDAVLAFSKALTDSEVLVDTVAKGSSKPVSDSASVAEDIHHIRTYKGLSDTEVLAEALRYTFVKGTISDTNLTADSETLAVDKLVSPDLVNVIESTAFTFYKTLADELSLSDSADVRRVFIRVFADNLTVPDFENWEFTSGTTAESATTSDVYNHVLTKNFFESTVLIDNMDGDIQYAFIKLVGELLSTSDAKVVDFTTNKSDNVTSSDGGVLSMQDYCDITYFLEDYVGVSRTF